MYLRETEGPLVMSSNVCARHRGPTELRWKDTRRESADSYGCPNFTEGILHKVGVFLHCFLPNIIFHVKQGDCFAFFWFLKKNIAQFVEACLHGICLRYTKK